ncbi:uncharacterized protein LOC142768653 isoform X2 [Rhipicephalus microplus]|uniref:uncharacterized protein LOC142768653 isoform X2 n=1 Tax=Rhipicephalus microplus TaxID=6941 RepID=UPI003F6AE780
MAHLTPNALTCSCIMVMVVSLLCPVQSKENVANGTLARGRAELNLSKVLNTSLPLYLYSYCSNIFGLDKCEDENCTVETYTCEHMRKIMLTNTTYNFTLSLRNNKTMWDNTTYHAEFVNMTPRKPPTEMMYNTTTVETLTSMYVTGPLPNNTPPEVYCQAHFLTLCPQRIIYKPYNSNCTVNRTICKDEEEQTQRNYSTTDEWLEEERMM